VVTETSVEAETYAIAVRIADRTPLAARRHKHYVERLTVKPKLIPADPENLYACFNTEDYGIGIGALSKKTRAGFRGR